MWILCYLSVSENRYSLSVVGPLSVRKISPPLAVYNPLLTSLTTVSCSCLEWYLCLHFALAILAAPFFSIINIFFCFTNGPFFPPWEMTPWFGCLLSPRDRSLVCLWLLHVPRVSLLTSDFRSVIVALPLRSENSFVTTCNEATVE